MSPVRITVTAEHIAASTRGKSPVQIALQDFTGEAVDVDGDGPDTWVATISQSANTLVVELPGCKDQLNAWWEGESIEPFDFDIELVPWLVAFVAKGASTDEQAEAVLASEARA